MEPEITDVRGASALTGLAVQTLYNLRSTGGDAPPSFTLRGRVRYYVRDINAWIAKSVPAN